MSEGSKNWELYVFTPKKTARIHYSFLGFFNIRSAYKDKRSRPESISIADGVILTEVMRYAILKLNEQKILRHPIYLQVMDCEHSRTQLSRFQDLPVILGLTSWQATYYMLSNQRSKAPVFNPLSSSASFDHYPGSKKSYKSMHRNLMRTVSPSALELQAILDILVKFDWKYVTLVGSNDLRTQELVQMFHKRAFASGVCVSKTIWLSVLPGEKEYHHVAKELASQSKTSIVILFSTTGETYRIIKEAGKYSRLIFVTWSGFRASHYNLKGISQAAKGILMIQHADTYDQGFEDYFMQLSLSNNRYSWFAEFWSDIFNCSIPEEYGILSRTFGDQRRRCSGYEKLDKNLVQLRYVQVKPILNALAIIACAMKLSERVTKCNYTFVSWWQCREMISREAMKFIGSKGCQLPDSVNLNKQGFYNRGFLIVNYNGTDFREVGSWKFNETARKSHFILDSEKIVFKEKSIPISRCYFPCKTGEIVDRGPEDKACCYHCRACNHNDVIVNNSCVQCPKHTRPNKNLTACVQLPITYPNMKHGKAWVIAFFASVGIALTAIVMGIFYRNRKTQIVKAASKDMSFIIFIVLHACFLSSGFYIMKPNVVICSIRRFIVGLSLNACYTPLLLKMIRIYRIFNTVKMSAQKPPLIGQKSQIIICLTLILGQVFLCVAWILNEAPSVKKQDSQKSKETVLLCSADTTNVVFNLIPCLILMSSCTVLAYKTRNYPSNFNEAFKISITMYGSCLLWAIYVPILVLHQQTGEYVQLPTLLTAGFMVTLGLVTLIGLFGSTVFRVVAYRETESGSSGRFSTGTRRVTLDMIPDSRVWPETSSMKLTSKDASTYPMGADYCSLCSQYKEVSKG